MGINPAMSRVFLSLSTGFRKRVGSQPAVLTFVSTAGWRQTAKRNESCTLTIEQASKSKKEEEGRCEEDKESVKGNELSASREEATRAYGGCLGARCR
jgi:hypothetical protein